MSMTRGRVGIACQIAISLLSLLCLLPIAIFELSVLLLVIVSIIVITIVSIMIIVTIIIMVMVLFYPNIFFFSLNSINANLTQYF
jgi:hypothetical protein